MSFLFKDLVAETSTSTGTGNFTLAGAAETRYWTFNAAFGTGTANRFRYVIHHRTALQWEIGQGYLSDATTLVRERVIASSNSNNAVNFSSGTKDVHCAPASVDFGSIYNVKAYGAKGNDFTDDTAAIQAAQDAAAAADGGWVFFPPGQYRFSATIARAPGIGWMGCNRGGVPGVDAPPQPTKLRWFGAQDGVMTKIDTSPGNASIHATPTVGIFFDGVKVSGVPTAGVHLDFVGGTIDQGTYIERCAFNSSTIAHVRFNGSTNFYIHDSRFDQWGGAAIYANCNSGRQVYLTIGGGCTADNWVGGELEKSGPFLDLDGSSGTTGTRAFIRIRDMHWETNGGYTTTYSAGATEAEKRGIIRCQVNPSIGGGLVQFVLEIDGCTNAVATNTSDHSLVYCTSASGTLQDHINAVRLVVTNFSGITRWNGNTQWNKVLGNVPAQYQWPYEGNASTNRVGQVGLFTACSQTTVFAERLHIHHAGTQDVQQLHNARIVPTINLGTGSGGGGYLYVEGGALKFRGGNGTITTIGPA